MRRPVLLLDLGGVLADLGDPVAAMRLDMEDAEFWRTWVGSPAVRAFETGAMSELEFLPLVEAELRSLDDTPFAERFHQWQLRPFAGLDDFITRAVSEFRVALLSNTNPVHWQQVTSATAAFDSFERLFLSFETGYFKPDSDAFRQVIEHFCATSGDIVYYDDSPANVATAKTLGIDARYVAGLDALIQDLDG